MHFSALLSGFAALAHFFVAGSPIPDGSPEDAKALVSSEPRLIWNGYELMPNVTDVTRRNLDKDSGKFSKRDEWCNTGALYSRADADQLQRNLQTLNPNRLKSLPARIATSWTIGTAKVCVYNHYVFENTHVKEWEVGWAMGYIAGKCCTGGNSQW
jgi:hypothetical protein